MKVKISDLLELSRIIDILDGMEVTVSDAFEIYNFKKRMEELMLNTGFLTKDLGTILVGSEAVNEGIINEVGGMKEAMLKLHEMIEKRAKGKN